MIRDKTLDIFVILLFGMGGIAILILAWAQPMSLSERIMTTSIGSTGLLGMLVRVLLRKHLQADTSAESVPVKSQNEDKQ